jgi:GTP pyrophosphokinase
MLGRELRRRRKKLPGEPALNDCAQSLGYADADAMLALIGQGDLSPVSVAARLYPETAAPSGVVHERLRQLTHPPVRGIRIQGVGNLMIQIAHCCDPVPGDPIVGLITRGRGVSVHQRTCRNIIDARVERERMIELQWDVQSETFFTVSLEIYGSDRPNMLADVSTAISKTKTNIREGLMQGVDAEARGHFIVEVLNRRQLNDVIRAIKGVRGVTRVERRSDLLPDSGSGREGKP